MSYELLTVWRCMINPLIPYDPGTAADGLANSLDAAVVPIPDARERGTKPTSPGPWWLMLADRNCTFVDGSQRCFRSGTLTAWSQDTASLVGERPP